MQLLTPRVVATAVRIEMTRLKMSFHFSLLIIICVFKINTVSFGEGLVGFPFAKLQHQKMEM